MSRLFEYRVPDRYYQLKLTKLLSNERGGEPQHQELFRSVSDEFWLLLHAEGGRVNPRLRDRLPGMPDESTQLQANGLLGDRALQDGLLVYRLFKFARLLRPGGVLIAHTWDRELIVRCGTLRNQSPALPSFQNHLPTMFKDTDHWLATYDNGRYCFDTSVESYGNVPSYLGETCIPKQYVLKHWTKHLQLFDFIDDRTVCPQNVIVATQSVPAGVERGRPINVSPS